MRSMSRTVRTSCTAATRIALARIALAPMVLALVMAGCSIGGGRRRVESAPARRLVGTWDVRFHVERTSDGPVSRDLRGELALLPNRWVTHDYPQLDVPTHYGSYDVNVRAAGFEPRDRGAIPDAIALTTGRDSAIVVLDPGEGETSVMMRGAWSGDSLVGRWWVDAGRGGAVADGHFVMARHGGG